jgi:hypothetical protein
MASILVPISPIIEQKRKKNRHSQFYMEYLNFNRQYIDNSSNFYLYVVAWEEGEILFSDILFILPFNFLSTKF